MTGTRVSTIKVSVRRGERLEYGIQKSAGLFVSTQHQAVAVF
jgi:hypothetical protein